MTEAHGTFPNFTPHPQKVSPISLPANQPIWNHLFEYAIPKVSTSRAWGRRVFSNFFL